MASIKQPNSRMCFICGLENPVGLHLHIYETETEIVESSYVAPPHFQGYPGVVHGGIVAAILDEISGTHTWARSRPRPASCSQPAWRSSTGSPCLSASAFNSSEKRADYGKSAEAWGGIYHGQTGELLAEGDALLIDVPKTQFDKRRPRRAWLAGLSGMNIGGRDTFLPAATRHALTILYNLTSSTAARS